MTSNSNKRLVSTFLMAMLVAILAGCSADETSVASKLKEGKQKSAHLIQVVEIQQGNLGQQLVYPARVAANLKARIHNRVEGEITELPFYEGDPVEKGQLIARLDDQLLKAELDKAIAEREQAKVDVIRLKKLVRKKAASTDELNQAQTELNVSLANEKVLKTKLGYSRLSAPFRGVISERLVEPGDILKTHTHILTIIDPDSLMIMASIPERLLVELSLGDRAMTTVDALGQQEYEGRISRIYPALNDRSLSGKVEITLEQPPTGLRAGQFSRIRVEGARKTRLIVPFPTLQRDERGEFIYRLKGKAVERVSVTSGARLGNLVEIKGDLQAGEKIVRRGFLKLKHGKSIRIVKDNISQ